MKTKQERIDKVVHQLIKLKEEYPDVEVYIELPSNLAICKIGDANIYDTIDGRIAIDAE